MKLVFLSLLLLTTAVYADPTTSVRLESNSDSYLGEQSSTLKESDLIPSEKKRKDIDEEITNARLRAVSGAKSLWSVQSKFEYVGSSIREPGASTRPKLSPGRSVENDVKLTGRVALKYRATDHNSLNLGVGLGWLTPGHTGQKAQSEDPYFGFHRVFGAGSVQNMMGVVVQKYTADSATSQGYNFNTYMDYMAVTNIGTSRWSAGGIAFWIHNYFTQANVRGGIENLLNLCPFAEYAMTDRVSIRSVYNGISYYAFQSAPSTYTHDSPTQSLGLGLSITRDIYFFPNVQWAWEDIRADKTNVGIQANINL